MTSFPQHDLPPLRQQQIRAVLVRTADRRRGLRSAPGWLTIPVAALAALAVLAAVAGIGLGMRSLGETPRTGIGTGTGSGSRHPVAPPTDAVRPAFKVLLASAVSISTGAGLLAVGTMSGKTWLLDAGHPTELTALAEFGGTDDSAASVALSPDGTLLATSGEWGSVRIWDVSRPRSPRLVQTLPTTTIYVPTLVFSPDGRLLATGGYDNKVTLWNVRGTSVTFRSTLSAGDHDIVDVAFDSSGGHLAAASYSHIFLWDLTGSGAPRMRAQVPVAGGGGAQVRFSPDGRTLAVASGDLTLWNVSDLSRPARVARVANGGVSIAYDASAASRDGSSTAATLSIKDHLIKIWNLSDPAAPRLVATHPGTWNVVSEDVAFSADGHDLIAVAETGLDLIAVP